MCQCVCCDKNTRTYAHTLTSTRTHSLRAVWVFAFAFFARMPYGFHRHARALTLHLAHWCLLQAERREWQAEHRLGAAERRKFHKDAKKRVINRLMRPTLLENIVAAVKAFFEERRASQNKGRSKVQSSADDADIEKGVPGGEEDEEEEEDGPRKGGGGADSDSDEDDAGGGAGKSKGKGAARASSSRGSKGERGLSEAETEADRPEPPDSDDD